MEYSSPHGHALSLLFCCACCLALCLPALAGSRTITVTEPLNRTWNNELLTYPFEAPKEQCLPASVTLNGPSGAVPVQLSDVQLWPNSPSLKSAKLSFVLPALAPQSVQNYTVNYAMTAPATLPPADLQVTKHARDVEIVSSRFGVRLLLGEERYATPKPVAEAPGPILGMRLADGAWFGGSQLYGATAVQGWVSTLTAEGPAFARVVTVYSYTDGNTFTLVSQLAAGDTALLLDMDVKDDRITDGWNLRLNPGVTIKEGTKISGARIYAKELPATLNPQSTDPAFLLNPWPGDGWFPDSPAAAQLKLTDHTGELYLTVRDSGAWVQPQAEFAWKNFTNWGEGMPMVMWDGWMRKRIPLLADAQGAYLQVSLAQGQRKWAIAHRTDGLRLLEVMQCRATGAYTVQMPTLNEVNALPLAWPDGNERHPFVYLNAREMTDGGLRNGAALADAQNIERMRAQLDCLGNMDLMRIVMDTTARYDALINSDQLTPQERKLRKAQMAFLCYQVINPGHWSYERGYCTGNPNMTVSRIANLAIAALAIRDNPQGKVWAQYAINWMKYWLQEVTDEQGYWPESGNYAHVSWADFIQVAIAARKAKMYDFFADPKFKQMAIFYEKSLTPPDPQRYVASTANTLGAPATAHPRILAPYGRGVRGDSWGLSGLLARATASSDPAFSRTMQWSWRESGYCGFNSHGNAGMNEMYVDRNLAAEAPNWTSEFFAHFGYLLRSHVGTPTENYLLYLSQYHRNADGEIWPSDTGSIAKWFANGVPIGGNFNRLPETATPLMTCRVALAANWDPAKGVQPDSWYTTVVKSNAFSTSPYADYVDVTSEITEVKPFHPYMPVNAPAFPLRDRVGVAPLHWQRQLLLVKDEMAGGPSYLVLRDTVHGKQPTSWHFWTFSEKIGTPAELANREAFLKDQPGAKVATLRELHGDRFVAAGQYGLDIDYYIASPTNTPRATLRYGINNLSSYGNSFLANDFQDLMHLELPGDGAYFVALMPRAKAQPVTQFATLGNGTVIGATGAFGVDYAFLSDTATAVKGEGVTFDGVAASVQDRANGTVLALLAPGTVLYRDFGLHADTPATLRVSCYTLTLSVPDSFPGGSITLEAPGSWSAEGVTAVTKRGTIVLTLPAGAHEVKLRKK